MEGIIYMQVILKGLIKFVAYFILLTLVLYYLVEVPFSQSALIALVTYVGSSIFNFILDKIKNLIKNNKG